MQNVVHNKVVNELIRLMTEWLKRKDRRMKNRIVSIMTGGGGYVLSGSIFRAGLFKSPALVFILCLGYHFSK